MDPIDLPSDLFLYHVLPYLRLEESIFCRRVSRAWNAVFTSNGISLHLLKLYFPRSREARLAAAAAEILADGSADGSPCSAPEKEEAGSDGLDELQLEVEDHLRGGKNWTDVFTSVALRYNHLARANPRSIEKIQPVIEGGWLFEGLPLWDRHMSIDTEDKPFHYPETVWSYGEEEGLLVYPGPVNLGHSLRNGCGVSAEKCFAYRALDLATGDETEVPFDLSDKIVRRVRLAAGILVFEWAEKKLVEHDGECGLVHRVHRHFVTFFDVKRKRRDRGDQTLVPPPPRDWDWAVTFRSEWNMHFFGLSLVGDHRFFSAHTSTHYASYHWYPMCSEQINLLHDPLETLVVWDISRPWNHRPSLEQEPSLGERMAARARAEKALSPTRPPTALGKAATGATSPGEGGETTMAGPSSSRRQQYVVDGPTVVRSMTREDLHFYGVRQRLAPRMRNLAMDDRNLYFEEEDHRWTSGIHASSVPPRAHTTWCTGIPIFPAPSGDADGERDRPNLAEPVQGPPWLDECNLGGDHMLSFFCPRTSGVTHGERRAFAAPSHGADLPWYNPEPSWDIGRAERLGLQEPEPVEEPRLVPEDWFWGNPPPNPPPPPPSPPTKTTTTMRSRPLGHAPCWRHEDFPYLTISEVMDAAAGVRVAARSCFLAEAHSDHINPALFFSGPFGADSHSDHSTDELSEDSGEESDCEEGEHLASRKPKPWICRPPWAELALPTDPAEVPRLGEVESGYDLYKDLMGKGRICGDERWIVGEDQRGQITIARF